MIGRLLFDRLDLAPAPALEFTVHDEPVPSGIRPVPLRKRNPDSGTVEVVGSRLAEGRDRKHEHRIIAWRDLLRRETQHAMGGRPLLLEPLAVEFTFYRQRIAGHYRTGRHAGLLKDSAPAHPTTRPDVLKLARLVEDALTSVAWGDDAQIVDERLCEVFVPRDRPPGVRVRVWPLLVLEREAVDLERRLQLVENLMQNGNGPAEAGPFGARDADDPGALETVHGP